MIKSLHQILLEAFDKELEQFIVQTKKKHNLNDLEMFLHGITGHLRLDHIALEKKNQRQGHGTKALEDIVAFADKHQLPMSLRTAEKDKRWGTTSSSRLKKFYKRFGFKENKGRNTNFTVSDNMIRRFSPRGEAK